MADGEAPFPPSVAPVASVWCRQVDNEAESPGYTAIPDEFPGRRETLEAIRIVGNLTINVADTHDYWDPDPASSLSFYPNLFLYPAGSGQYTAVGRMFLSTEDRPRLGMKTLVFSTQELLASGDFGGLVLRAYATMDGRAGRTLAPPDPSLFSALGEGFLFHKGATEPVVVIASDLWESASRTVLDLVRVMPASLVALGAFLVFPYFLPATKVNVHEFTEQLPLALAVMRVPRAEAGGDRHAKRMESWKAEPVALRDLTSPPAPPKGRETLPLVLQYVRDHAEAKGLEVAQRVDLVEAPRLPPVLADLEHQGGRDRRKEMWRIGTAMETAALLLAHPRGRSSSVSAETTKRANEYLGAHPGEAVAVPTPTLAPEPVVAPSTASSATPAPARPSLPAWLQPPPAVAVPAAAGAKVPVSTEGDPSLRTAPPPEASALPSPVSPSAASPPDPPAASPPPAAPAAPAPAPVSTPAARTAPPPLNRETLFPRLQRPPPGPAPSPSPASAAPPPMAAPVPSPPPPATMPTPAPSPTPTFDAGGIDARISSAVRASEDRLRKEIEERVQSGRDASERTRQASDAELRGRVTALEGRPIAAAGPQPEEITAQVQAAIAPSVAELRTVITEETHRASEAWAERFRRELHDSTDLMIARGAKAEEELRAALAAQLELEILEARQQGTALREETEANVRTILAERIGAAERDRAGEIHEAEQRMVHLIEGRAKESEGRLAHSLSGQMERIAQSADERLAQAERRSAAERDARLAELTETQTAAVAGLQVRMQSFVEQKLRELQVQEQEKYLSLLARMKASLEESLERSIASPVFDAALRGKIADALEEVRIQQATSFGKLVAESEASFRQERDEAAARLEELEGRLGARETDLANLEATIRNELADVDRRLLVVNDHILPLVRQTWLKVSQHEQDDRARPRDQKLTALREELTGEITRVEQEMRARAVDLRNRLEASVTSNGRIWLNFVRQMSPDAGYPPAATAGGHRVIRRSGRSAGAAPAVAPPPPEDPDDAPFEELPPNPMAPADTPADRPTPEPTGRKTRRS